MKVIFSILVCLIIACNSSIDFEEEVCSCISSNFSQIEVDYQEVLEAIEADLIANNIVDKTYVSRINQLENVKENGEIKNIRTYESIKWEELGMQTIKHCVNLHTYGYQDQNPEGIFRMFNELELISRKYQKSLDLFNLRKETADIILKYSSHGQSKLWKIVQIDYLYRFSETKEVKNIKKLGLFRSTPQDTFNTVRFHIAADDKMFLENIEIAKNDICTKMKGFFLEKKGIYFSNEKNTKYQLYLEVYNSFKDCVLTLRMQRSLDMNDKEYKSLNDKEKLYIDELVPLRIVETAPK